MTMLGSEIITTTKLYESNGDEIRRNVRANLLRKRPDVRHLAMTEQREVKLGCHQDEEWGSDWNESGEHLHIKFLVLIEE